MNIYDQVDKLLNEQENRPTWVDEILFELKEVKRVLHDIKATKTKKSDKSAYFAFVKKLKDRLRADIINNKYPQIRYKDRELGINFKGFIYDKSTSKELPAQEAFEVYRFLYENRGHLDKYLSKV